MLRATGAFFCIGVVNFRLSLCLIVSVGNAVLGVPSEIPLDGQIFCLFLHQNAKNVALRARNAEDSVPYKVLLSAR